MIKSFLTTISIIDLKSRIISWSLFSKKQNCLKIALLPITLCQEQMHNRGTSKLKGASVFIVWQKSRTEQCISVTGICKRRYGVLRLYVRGGFSGKQSRFSLLNAIPWFIHPVYCKGITEGQKIYESFFFQTMKYRHSLKAVFSFVIT